MSVADAPTSILPQPPYPWFVDPWESLARRVDQGRLPHALLVSGAKGVGTLGFAQAFAQFLLCVAPQQGQSCRSCKSCQLVEAGTHPDLKFVAPDTPTSQIKIDQIRSQQDFLANTPQQGGRKVLVLSPSEKMNVNAANALLKNLEEPGKDTFFLLVSYEPAQLMATVRSRCSMVPLRMPEQESALQWLARHQVEDASALLSLAGGKPLTVLEWVDEGTLAQMEALESSLIALLEQKLGFIDVAKKWSSFAPLWVVERLMSIILYTLRDIKRETLSAPLQQLLAEAPELNLHKLYEELLTNKRRLLSGANPNNALMMEELAMAWGSTLTT